MLGGREGTEEASSAWSSSKPVVLREALGCVVVGVVAGVLGGSLAWGCWGGTRALGTGRAELGSATGFQIGLQCHQGCAVCAVQGLWGPD